MDMLTCGQGGRIHDGQERAVKEFLRIRKLGPLKDAKIEPRPLTVIIGPQASGKSLIAQCLYFFRGLELHLARRFSTSWMDDPTWYNQAIKEILDEIRGVPFGYFANGTAALLYEGQNGPANLGLQIYSSNRRVRANTSLKLQMIKWLSSWDAQKSKLLHPYNNVNLFIPTERSIFTRLEDKKAGMLFDPVHPEPFRRFAEEVIKAKQVYSFLDAKIFPSKKETLTSKAFAYIVECQRLALSGVAYIPRSGPKVWKWKTVGDNITSGGAKQKPKIVPIQATASGQTEAWPFFVIAATAGLMAKEGYFYFEEPETHLHPAAQIQVANVIGYLVNMGQKFVITTHSPFLLYILNNMIMRNLVWGETFREGKVALRPDDVAAYRIVDGNCMQIIDHQGTQLIEETELDQVANQLGAEFDELLGKVDL